MIERIRLHILERFEDRRPRYQLTADSILKVNRLSPGAADLLLAILQKLGRGCQPEHLVVTGDYQYFGYNDRKLFSRHRCELTKAGFIEYNGKDHIVSAVTIDYTSRRQYEWLLKLFRVKKERPVNLGQMK